MKSLLGQLGNEGITLKITEAQLTGLLQQSTGQNQDLVLSDLQAAITQAKIEIFGQLQAPFTTNLTLGVVPEISPAAQIDSGLRDSLAFLMPIGLVLRGIDNGAMRFAPVVMIGALSFLFSVGVMIKGATAEKQAGEAGRERQQ